MRKIGCILVILFLILRLNLGFWLFEFFKFVSFCIIVLYLCIYICLFKGEGKYYLVINDFKI